MSERSGKSPIETYIDEPVVLTIGVFDGVHLGHQHLISQVLTRARELGKLSAVMTFDRHPLSVLKAGSHPPMLTTLEEKLDLLGDLGVSVRAVLHFGVKVAKLDPREFLEMVGHRLRLAELWIGPDFALGRGREGGMASLTAVGQELGFTVRAVGPFLLGGETVSSTLIRKRILSGDVRTAGAMLGRPPVLRGRVISGHRRGQSLGFPTANLEPQANSTVPAYGIYAVTARLAERVVPGVTSIGIRPTFDAGARSIETHLLDYDGDLYGREIVLQFHRRLRSEIKFPSPTALVEQMNEDVRAARDALGSQGSP